MSDAPELEALLDPIRQAMADMEARALRFGHIEATIRVNAMRHGATGAMIEDFIAGRADFVAWMCETVEGHQADLATAAETAAREEGVRLGMLAAADIAARRAEELRRDGCRVSSGDLVIVAEDVREITADPVRVAAIAASVKGGE